MKTINVLGCDQEFGKSLLLFPLGKNPVRGIWLGGLTLKPDLFDVFPDFIPICK